MIFPGGYYFSSFYSTPDTSANVIYTAPSGVTQVNITQIWSADDGGSARTITLEAGIGGTYYVLVYVAAISANAPLIYAPDPLVLSAGDTIRATTDASGVDIMVSGAIDSRRV